MFKTWPLLAISTEKLKMNYILKKELSFHEGVLAQKGSGSLHFWMYNPGRILRHGIMVPVLCESALGYIMQIYDGKCGISAGTVGFMLQPLERKAITFPRTITTVSNL
jgi:hypothetical protein